MNKLIVILFFITFSFGQKILVDSVLFSDEPLKNPNSALLLSAALPGAGQYYNESYVKTTIIAASFIYFMAEAISYNNDINDLNKLDLKYTNFNTYKSKLDGLYDDRNVALWRLLAVYTYNLLDAYIGAYLFGFDQIMDSDKTKSSTFFADYKQRRFNLNLAINF